MMNMNIIIHGTKGGWKVLYPLSNIPSIVGDSRSASATEKAVGQQCYSIAFNSDGCTITKLHIIRDIPRNMATGNIAFSLHLANYQKMVGVEIKSLLDGLSKYYIDQYVKENNLDNVREDWSFVNEIQLKYKIKNLDNDDIEQMQSGKYDPAVIYYDTDSMLTEYFDNLYQIEYSSYKQVFFIDSKLKSAPENPLHALRHSNDDLTGKIDLNNPKYRVLFPQGLSVFSNNRELKNRDKIRKKDIFRIDYYKKNYIPQTIEGNCITLCDEYPQCVTLNTNDETISIAPIQLKPESKSVNIRIVDNYNQAIVNPIVSCRSYQGNKSIVNNTIYFEGDELDQSWRIEVSATDYEDRYSEYIPSKDVIGVLEFKLRQVKCILLNVKDKLYRSKIESYSAYASCRAGNGEMLKRQVERNGRIYFFDSDIDYDWQITVSASGYKQHVTQAIFIKNETEPIIIELDREQRVVPTPSPCYMVDGGEYGILNNVYYSNRVDGKDIPGHIIRPNKGYRFSHFNLIEETGQGYSGRLVAQYEKKDDSIWSRFKREFIVGGAIGVLLSCLLIFFLMPTNSKQSTIDQQQVLEYIAGNELLPDTLDFYAKEWKSYEPKDDNTGLKWFNPATWVGGTQAKSEEYNNWESVLNKITNAQQLRIQVDNLDLTKLNTEPSLPRVLMDMIRSIDDQNRAVIIEKLGNTRSLSIWQIADKIDEINKGLTPDIGTEIRNYLQNADLTLEKIEKYHSMKGLDNIDDKLNPSLLLAKLFWQLPKVVMFVNKQQTIQTWNIQQYKTKVDSDPYLRDNKFFKDLIEKLAGIANPRLPSSLPQVDKNKPLSEIGGILISSSKSGAVPISNASAGNVGQSQNSQQASPQTAVSNSNKDLIEYLQSDKIKKSELEAYLKTTSGKLKNSIDLAIKFWKLDGNNTNTYYSYEKELSQSDLKDSKLHILVKSLCDPQQYDNSKLKYPKSFTQQVDIDKVNKGNLESIEVLIKSKSK